MLSNNLINIHTMIYSLNDNSWTESLEHHEDLLKLDDILSDILYRFIRPNHIFPVNAVYFQRIRKKITKNWPYTILQVARHFISQFCQAVMKYVMSEA